ncbi:MAG: MaoC family dehydratase N-terminal domain-containing protein [Deltaproteobacteria bacterium]|nr:MaoC family dehydratase N-terminal domain-containing protein [Deltaproteobacteria bacterium]
MSLNRNLIGKQYPPQDYGVTAEATMQYARAYNEDNPWFFDTTRPGGIIAPPMFGVVMSWLPIIMVMSDSDLGVDLLRLLHAEQDMYFSRPVAPGDIVTSTAKILAIEAKATGESVVLEVSCTNQRGEPVQRLLFTAFIRGKGKRDKRNDEPSEEPPSGEPLLRVSQSIDLDQTYRYAHASGDHNPIHVDENMAKMAGLPGIIVHGLCTMAFASKVMIDQLCDRDPRRLKRLRTRFSRPVFPGQMITTAIWPRSDRGGLKVYAYETENPNGKAVIKDGLVEVATI